MSDTTEAAPSDNHQPAKTRAPDPTTAHPGEWEEWESARIRAVAKDRADWRDKASASEAKARMLEEQMARVQSEARRKVLEADILSELPRDRREPARHLLLGVAAEKGLDFSRDIDADTSSALREYVVSQFAVQAQSAQSAPPAPKAPPVAQPPAPMMAADHDWSKQATLNGLTNDQRLQFASKNPEGYQRALRDQFRSR